MVLESPNKENISNVVPNDIPFSALNALLNSIHYSICDVALSGLKAIFPAANNLYNLMKSVQQHKLSSAESLKVLF